MRTAALSGLLVWIAALILLSPWLRVRTVVWTGSSRLPEKRQRAFEVASLGQPLLLLPERLLRDLLGTGGKDLRIALRRHPPGTLEVHVEPRRAAACTESGLVLDDQGGVLGAAQALPDLTRLVGFAVRDRRLAPECRRLFALLRRGLAEPALRPSRIERRGGELELVLDGSGTRVRARVDRLEEDLLKLRLYEQSLGPEEMPADIDLRFRDQVVVRGGARVRAGRTAAAARAASRAATGSARRAVGRGEVAGVRR